MTRNTGVLMLTFKSHAHKYSGKISKNECLYKSNQYFDHVNKHYQQYKEWRSSQSQRSIHSAENEYKANKTYYDNVA